MAKKTLFDKLYAAGEAVVQTINKPARERMLRRASERVSDNLTDKLAAAEIKSAEFLHKLANVDNEDEANRIFKEIALLDRQIEESQALVDSVKKLTDKLFSETDE